MIEDTLQIVLDPHLKLSATHTPSAPTTTRPNNYELIWEGRLDGRQTPPPTAISAELKQRFAAVAKELAQPKEEEDW